MKMKLRFLSFILAFVLAAGNIEVFRVYAAPAGTEQDAGVWLSGLEITDLSEPVAGQTLDDKAVVRSAEGVVWEIPVIWTDDTGRAAAVAEGGRKYFPTFAFYVPSGHKIMGMSASGAFSVRLPGFVANLQGIGNLIFVADGSTGITYITWNFANISGIPAAYPVNAQTDRSSGSGSDNSSDNEHSSDPSGSGKEDPFWEAEVHCGPNTIEKYGSENLAWLVNLIKHEIEPRAIAALLEGFPTFRSAAENNELGTQIGLYVYDVTVDTNAQNPDINKKDCVAYVNHNYNADSEWVYMVGVNIDGLLELKDGRYEFKEGKDIELENTITHELMHGLMGDYVRTGMASNDWCYAGNPNPEKEYNAFPKWFIEGSATAVENAYVYHNGIFEEILSGNDQYTPEAISAYFSKPENSISYYKTDYNKDTTGAYVGGYLACTYLAFKVRNPGERYTSEDLRDGFNTILEMLHNGTSLDTIIKDNTDYTGIKDFEDKFLKTGDSADFCAGLLNFYKQVSDDNGNRANGSILLPFETTLASAVEGRTESSEDQSILAIIDTQNRVPSTVDGDTAIQSAGSYHSWGATDDNPDDYNNGIPAAARTLAYEADPLAAVASDLLAASDPLMAVDISLSADPLAAMIPSMAPDPSVPTDPPVPSDLSVPSDTSAPTDPSVPSDLSVPSDTPAPTDPSVPADPSASENPAAPADPSAGADTASAPDAITGETGDAAVPGSDEGQPADSGSTETQAGAPAEDNDTGTAVSDAADTSGSSDTTGVPGEAGIPETGTGSEQDG
ncbi:MAG: hypothetical protein K5770_11585 [Lachnospiraceae bacterium]|nr:hypothetical protein [Lachnospiraceae bacterium]